MAVERPAVRWGVPVLLLGSCVGGTAVSSHENRSEIPTLAFGSHVVLALQVALVLFYGALLLLVPVVRALSDGDLPVELSLRGARWREDLIGFGDGFLARLRNAEEEVLRADLESKEEIKLLRQELSEANQTLEVISDQLLERIVALEDESRELQR